MSSMTLRKGSLLFGLIAAGTLAAPASASAADKAVKIAPSRTALLSTLASRKAHLERYRPTPEGSFAVAEAGAYALLGVHGVAGLGFVRGVDGKITPSLLLGGGLGGGLGAKASIFGRTYYPDDFATAKKVRISGVYAGGDKAWMGIGVGLAEGGMERLSRSAANRTNLQQEESPTLGIGGGTDLLEATLRVPLMPAFKSRWLRATERVKRAEQALEKNDLASADKLLSKVHEDFFR